MKHVVCAILCSFHLLLFAILKTVGNGADFLGLSWSVSAAGIAAVVSAIVCKRPKLALTSLLFPILWRPVEQHVHFWVDRGNMIASFFYFGFWLFITWYVFKQVRILLSPTVEPPRRLTIKELLVWIIICAVVVVIEKQLLLLYGYPKAVFLGLLGLTLFQLSTTLYPLLCHPGPYRWHSILMLGVLFLLATGATLVGISYDLCFNAVTTVGDSVDSGGQWSASSETVFHFGGGLTTTDRLLRYRAMYRSLDLGTVLLVIASFLILVLVHSRLRTANYYQWLSRRAPFVWPAILLLVAFFMIATGSLLVRVAYELRYNITTVDDMVLTPFEKSQLGSDWKEFHFGGGFKTTDPQLRDYVMKRCQIFGPVLLAIAICLILVLCSRWLRIPKRLQSLFY
jgi:hypothetical protein